LSSIYRELSVIRLYNQEVLVRFAVGVAGGCLLELQFSEEVVVPELGVHLAATLPAVFDIW
jgi:hypothetical protein